jgi:hypothetical protein
MDPLVHVLMGMRRNQSIYPLGMRQPGVDWSWRPQRATVGDYSRQVWNSPFMWEYRTAWDTPLPRRSVHDVFNYLRGL